MPVALLAGFYRGQRLRTAHMAAWMYLDERAVYAQLLQEMEGPCEGLNELGGALEAALAALDLGAAPEGLLEALDWKAAAEGRPAPDAPRV